MPGKYVKTREPGIYRQTLESGAVRYRVVVSVGKDENGNYKQRTYTSTTMADAKAKKAEVQAEVAKGVHVHKRDELTVNRHLDSWLTGKRSLKPSTLAGYRHALKPARAAFGERPLQKITKADVDRLVNGLLTSSPHRPGGAAPRTINSMLVVLQQAFADAERQGVVPRNVVALVSRVSNHDNDDGEARRRFNTWSQQEAATFMDHVSDDRLSGGWTLTRLGLRLGEVMGMRWSDIDLDAGTLTVRRTRILVDGLVVEGTPKSQRSRRTLHIGPHAAGALRAAKKRQAEERIAAPAWLDSGFVVTDEIGRPLKPDVYQRAFKRHVEAAGVPGLRLHDVRHTSVTLMLDGGLPVHKVAAWHGHDPNMTYSVYCNAKADEETGALVDHLMFG